MDKQELIERIEDFPCEASLVTEMIRINKNTLLEWVKQLDEPQKTVVPQFVADLIEEARTYEWDLDDLFEHINERSGDSEISTWFYTLGNVDVLARAWLDGYEVEEEKRYLVKMKGVSEYSSYLNYDSIDDKWYLTDDENGPAVSTHHTRKQLEEAGFGEVFNSPLFEVEEVTE